MITWIAIKTVWASFLAWCKERWELIVGVVLGALAVFSLTKGSRDAAKALEKKNELIDTLLSSEAEASEKERAALKKNLEKFMASNKEAEEEFKGKITELDEKKKADVKRILSSDSPEEEIAIRLREYLK